MDPFDEPIPTRNLQDILPDLDNMETPGPSRIDGTTSRLSDTAIVPAGRLTDGRQTTSTRASIARAPSDAVPTGVSQSGSARSASLPTTAGDVPAISRTRANTPIPPMTSWLPTPASSVIISASSATARARTVTSEWKLTTSQTSGVAKSSLTTTLSEATSPTSSIPATMICEPYSRALDPWCII